MLSYRGPLIKIGDVSKGILVNLLVWMIVQDIEDAPTEEASLVLVHARCIAWLHETLA